MWHSNCTDTCYIASLQFSWVTESTMEVLIEELMDLHTSSSTFRQLFRSQQTTQIFADTYKSFVAKVSASPEVNQRTIRILEKLSHFGLALALDNAVAGSQKREVCSRVLVTLPSLVSHRSWTPCKLLKSPSTLRRRKRQLNLIWLQITAPSDKESHLLDSAYRSVREPFSKQSRAWGSGARQYKYLSANVCGKIFLTCELLGIL